MIDRAGVDLIYITTDGPPHFSARQVDVIKNLKAEYPSIELVVGNVVTQNQAKVSNVLMIDSMTTVRAVLRLPAFTFQVLIEAGVDGLVTSGGGDGCFSVDRSAASALYHVAR